MNQQEIWRGLWAIIKEKQDACKSEIEAVDRARPTERGALQLKAGIYNIATAAIFSSGAEQAMELMSKRFRNLIKYFPDLAAHYQGLPDEEKGIMETALYPEVFMRANFSDAYNQELDRAREDGDPQAIFKARIKKEILDDLLDLWRNFRLQNDLFTFAFEDKEDPS